MRSHSLLQKIRETFELHLHRGTERSPMLFPNEITHTAHKPSPALLQDSQSNGGQSSGASTSFLNGNLKAKGTFRKEVVDIRNFASVGLGIPDRKWGYSA